MCDDFVGPGLEWACPGEILGGGAEHTATSSCDEERTGNLPLGQRPFVGAEELPGDVSDKNAWTPATVSKLGLPRTCASINV